MIQPAVDDTARRLLPEFFIHASMLLFQHEATATASEPRALADAKIRISALREQRRRSFDQTSMNPSPVEYGSEARFVPDS